MVRTVEVSTARDLADELQRHIAAKLNTSLFDYSNIDNVRKQAKQLLSEYLSKMNAESETFPLCRVLSDEDMLDYHLLCSKKVGEYDLKIMTYREKIAFSYLFDVPATDIIFEFKPPESIDYIQLRIEIK